MLKSKRKSINRNERGAALGLVIICAFLIVLSIWGLFQMGMVMGGSRQVRNGVDAGVLNISKRIIEVKVPAQDKYVDVADSTGNVGMSNINRVWGKAFLINANTEAMTQDGQASGTTTAAAEGAFDQAKAINDQLFNRVSSDAVLNNYFQQMAHQRQASMLGADNKVEKGQSDECSVAMVDRGASSNLKFNPAQMPGKVQAKGSGQYLSGYTPMAANSKQFVFTSFRAGEMPHLIADDYFTQNRADKAPVGGSYAPVPNAFMRYGEVDAIQGKLTAMACAVANPQRSYNMAIPYAFATIQVGNTAKWYVENKKLSETPYGFKPQQYHKVIDYPLTQGGTLNGYASLGNEYSTASNLLDVMNALPGDHSGAFKKLVQRMQEIDPSFSMQKLLRLLESQQLKQDDSPEPPPAKYFLYPVYSSVDKTDPQIKIGSTTQDLPPWLNPQNPPEGLEKQIAQENKQKDKPNYCWDYISGGQTSTGKHWTEVYGNIMWQPGTGYGQHLGELRFARVTEIYFTGQPDTGN